MSRPVPAKPRDRAPHTRLFAGIAVATYLVLCVVLFRAILARNGGHFLYALDDPYIHLALAQNIAHGHYGINPGEPASPASSLLWPFLLAPFAHLSRFEFVPLLLNLLAGIAAAVLAGAAVARWPTLPSESPRLELIRRLLSTFALVFIANLLGLTFIGMEHTLQVFLAGAGAWGILCCLRARPIPLWCLIATAFGPLVRYENLGISVALVIALYGQRRPKAAVTLLAASILPLLLFSFFLHHLGLPWLPTSVLVKSQVPGATGLRQHSFNLIADNLAAVFTEPHHTLVAILFLTLAALAIQACYEPDRPRRFALTGAALAAGLHLLVGRFHWFHRYEVYIVFFSALIVLHAAHERPRGLLGWYAMGLFGCSLLYLQAAHDVPASSHDVFREQYQMHRFANDFYDGDGDSIAVNDLGLVSFDRRPGLYILDLWGLASPEAAKQHNKSTAWLDDEIRSHHVGLVMDYALWFSPPPRNWTLLGELCLNEAPIALGDPCVNYYATPEAWLPDVENDFNRFIATLPKGITVRYHFLPPSPPLLLPQQIQPALQPVR